MLDGKESFPLIERDPSNSPCDLQFLLSLCHAYQIADDCTNFSDEISDAINEAVDIANYAAVRWQHTPVPRNGTLLQDMLGAPDEDDVNTLLFAASEYRLSSPCGVLAA